MDKINVYDKIMTENQKKKKIWKSKKFLHKSPSKTVDGLRIEFTLC